MDSPTTNTSFPWNKSEAGPRIILFVGKGGVGKTTSAAATALASAKHGYRTIVLSTDPAHSLSDSFDMKLGKEPTPLSANLWGQETDVYYNLNMYWGVVQEWIKALISWRGVEELVADEIALLPGMEELANLLWINQHHKSGDFDVIIIDCAPTAETLQLLSFPDVANWWVERIMPVHRRLMGIVRPIVGRFSDVPLPTGEVYDAGEDLIRRLATLRSLLANPELASVRLVMNPEKMVIKEAHRTFTYLNLYGYAVDAIICNRLLPEEIHAGSYLSGWKQAQLQHHQTVVESFSPLPVFDVPLFEQEVVGLEMLDRAGQAIYGGGDPTTIFFRGHAQEFIEDDGRYRLTIAMPFASKEEINLVRNGDELIVSVGNQRRNITLPRSLLKLVVKSARFQDERLVITFAPDESA